MRSVIDCLLAVAVCAALGCREKESGAPPPLSSGGGPPPVGGVNTDSGMPARPPSSSDEDAGSDGVEDAGTGIGDVGRLPAECQNVPVVQLPSGELPAGTEASTTSPADFRVSRLLALWDGDCAEPVFRIELSDGECPDGRDHKLTFLIDAAALRDGTLGLGLHTIAPEPNDVGVSIRYVRPASLDPSGEWGTCLDVTGTLDLVGSPPSTEQSSTLDAAFDLDLTACDGGDAEPQLVNGTFNVVMQRGLSEVCPDM